MVPQFVDVSQFQQEPIDWQVYKKWSAQVDGVSRVAMRSSYGYGYADQQFQAHRDNALAAGIDQIIYYHYAYPQYNTPDSEANWQKQVVEGMRISDLVALDIEENVGESQFIANWAYTWLALQTENYGRQARVYASSDYILNKLQDNRLADFPLWLANWQFTPDERPVCPLPWKSYEFLQYTDHATIPGIPTNVDADIFLGSDTPVSTQPSSKLPGKFQLQAALDEWNAEGIDAPTGSDIYNLWLADYCSGVFHGPPRTKELLTVDWSGKPVIKQYFQFDHVEFYPNVGLGGWYVRSGKI